MTTSESKCRFFTKNEYIRIDSHNESNRIVSNRELECSTEHVRASHRERLHLTIGGRSYWAGRAAARPVFVGRAYL